MNHQADDHLLLYVLLLHVFQMNFLPCFPQSLQLFEGHFLQEAHPLQMSQSHSDHLPEHLEVMTERLTPIQI